jgi:sedoheptulose-bisphosphatase
MQTGNEMQKVNCTEKFSEDPDLQKVYEALLLACEDITMHIRYNTSNKITTANDFGDVQLDFDVQIDSILFEHLKDCGVVYAASSEERPYLTKLNENGKFLVTFDPLDGSSIIDSNLAIGTIAGIWLKKDGQEDPVGFTARNDMVGAALSCYGSRTNIVVYNAASKTVDELTLQKKVDGSEDEWVMSHKGMAIKPEGRFFSPGNAKSMKYNKGYRDCIQYWAKNGYTLRYSGGMAPDCFHVFMKGEGIFSSVSFPGKVKPKLRFLYEVAPIAFLCEMAGGSSSDGEISILDVPASGYDHIHDIIIGSSEEVNRCVRFLQVYTHAAKK